MKRTFHTQRKRQKERESKREIVTEEKRRQEKRQKTTFEVNTDLPIDFLYRTVFLSLNSF